MQTHLINAVRAALLSACLSVTPAWAAGGDKAILLVIENGATVLNQEAALETIRSVLSELTGLNKKKATRDTAIHIITTANPTQTTWSGTPDQLAAYGHAIWEDIAFRQTCSDLLLAWNQALLSVRITRPEELKVISIGPAIHAGFPCDQGEVTITLPQAVPQGFALADIAAQASFLRLLNVHGDQLGSVLDHLESAGVLTASEESEALDFDLLDAARTRSQLGRVLEGGR